MPELPEVEHTRKNLDRWMRGARIVEVRTRDDRIVRPMKPASFVKGVTGRVIERIERRGKWLRLLLDDGMSVFTHLGMTGWFERGASTDHPLRFDRVTFELSRKGVTSRVTYVDPRRWGRMVLTKEDLPVWSSLGPDPLDDGIDEAALADKLARRKKRSIKEALMDQKVLAGVGNIQAIEALWKAKIDPRSPAGALTTSDIRAVTRGLRWTIDRTLADLAKGDGGAKNPFKIYGRKGEACPRCGEKLERLTLGGRTTTFCSACQRRLRS
ncbi:MAG TPA: bifunctional DNA-formamidopyrimidine glycosylase/DNA-(apurinic or apyrimidinic site) lyase [Labilithrix sp.]|nr:bifunctional DNA-formamidopyrimidine glycosylase/DNA-(apurinic or apyrimidinic site) lyase [Labilithrix sp.]